MKKVTKNTTGLPRTLASTKMRPHVLETCAESSVSSAS